MRNRNLLAVVITLIALIVTGCATSRTQLKEMYEGPNFNAAAEGLPHELRVFNFALNPRLDVADTAFLPDLGINMPSMSWPFAHYKKKAEGGFEISVYKAVRREVGNVKFLQAVIPADMEMADGDFITVPDHAGRRMYDLKGNWAMGDFKKINPEKFSGFLTTVKAAQPKLVVAGTPEYDELIKFYVNFIVQDAKQVQELAYAIAGAPIGTVLNQEQIAIINNNPWFKERLKESLVTNWIVLVTYPLMTPETYGAQILIAKGFDVSRLIWEDDPKQPGYMDRTLTAAQGYDMMEYYWREYQKKMTAVTIRAEDMPLSAADRENIKGTPCEDSKTYAEANKCFGKANRAIAEENVKMH